MIRSAVVTVRLHLTMPEDYTGEIDADIEGDLRYALRLDPTSTLGEAELDVLDATAVSFDDDTPLPPEED